MTEQLSICKIEHFHKYFFLSYFFWSFAEVSNIRTDFIATLGTGGG